MLKSDIYGQQEAILGIVKRLQVLWEFRGKQFSDLSSVNTFLLTSRVIDYLLVIDKLIANDTLQKPVDEIIVAIHFY